MEKLKDKLNRIENLYKKIFLLILGSFLMIAPFWAGGLSMFLLSDTQVEWTKLHSVFVSAGVVFFVGGWAFNNIAKAIVAMVTRLSEKLSK
ncbi:hypothetical protein [Maribacter sp. ACAM166]|uniref:hypothetical protein n=1 Tax=Maribacter sp. ACAM166 TaxID=2508996 RepID=UPI0010FEC238|nr:hypothetical protein [Maribacter sp. ACAM166]TLP81343.1 hypothetical protein ES765_04875 [Maribacter sp. ACAM166]